MSDDTVAIRGSRGDPAALTDDELLARYDRPERPDWLRVNFVATLDGSATADGVSGSLGGPADSRVFDLLRRLADVVLVAAGTVRDEGYGPMRLGDADVAWRRAHGMADHPVFAIVSGSLALDPDSAVFADAPVRPIVLAAASARADRRAALEAVADVVTCGEDSVDAAAARQALVDRGLGRIHCEGGPSFLGALVAADLVDELCLTIGPTLEGGFGPRIAVAHPPAGGQDPEGQDPGGSGADGALGSDGSHAPLRPMRLGHVLFADDDVLLTRYVRSRGADR